MNDSDKFQNIFPFILENMADEIGNLIGEAVELHDENILQGNLAEIYTFHSKKFVLTGFNLKNGSTGSAYLLVNLDMAIELGGKLIMLPPNEIAVCKKQGKLEGELLDAFSEITNIITGIINSCCQEYFPQKKLHFIKGEMEICPPRTNSLPIPEGGHTLFSGSFVIKEDILGIVQLFFPHTLTEDKETEEDLPVEEKSTVVMGITEQLLQKFIEKPDSNQPQECIPKKQAGKWESYPIKMYQSGSEPGTETVSENNQHDNRTPLISVISQDKSQLKILQENLAQENIEVMPLSLENDLKSYLNHKNLCCVLLFIKKVNDLGFAQTIKVRTALKKGCPLIVAGPEWTRTKVLTALKYGANDILTTPAGKESILNKFQKHFISNQG
jgi:ActR/RegA family two-component response regulator